jgi:hypothetical protein
LRHCAADLDNPTTAMNGHVTVMLRGGLANQMFQYALGLAMTETASRQLYVDTTDLDGDAKRDYALGVCNPPPQRVSSAGRFATGAARSTPLWHLFGRRWLAMVPGGPRIVREHGQAFDRRVLSLPGSMILDGYWQSEEYFYQLRPLIERTFDWSSIATSSVAESLLESIETPQSVAVHVRRGDYVREAATNAFHGVCEADYYSRAAKLVGEHVTDAHYFIFSDDIDWAEQHLVLPGKRTVVRHDRNPAPHVDMWLMSRCRHAIIANSSYSWWAAWLTERPGKCIVAPRLWFRDMAMQSITPVPSRWHVT